MSARKPRASCRFCGKETPRPSSIFCDARCQHEHEYERYIALWKAGRVDGNRGGEKESAYVRRYLFRRSGGRCERCGWSKVNPVTKKVPLTINHKDGNWKNTVPRNIELICPNCHSLTPNYGSLNMGNGRQRRTDRRRRTRL